MERMGCCGRGGCVDVVRASPASSPQATVIPGLTSVIPASFSVIPAYAGI